MPPGDDLVAVAVARISAQRLDPRPVCGSSSRFPASTPEHGHPPLPGALRDLVEEPALADARLARHEHEAPSAGHGRVKRTLERIQLGPASDQRVALAAGRRRLAALTWRARRGHGLRALNVQLGSLRQDRLLEISQRRTWLDADLLHQRLASLAKRGERIALAARAIEREHQLAAQALAERVASYQRLDLAGEIRSAESEVGVDPVLERTQPQLREASDLRRGERLEGEVRQGRAAPQSEGQAQLVGGRPRFARGQ